MFTFFIAGICDTLSTNTEYSTEDDITVLLSEIVEINNKILSVIETGQKTEYLMVSVVRVA